MAAATAAAVAVGGVGARPPLEESLKQRRFCLRLLGGAAAFWLLSGHSPYRQWDIYRKARLVLLVSAADAASIRLADAMAAVFSSRLPQSRATVARARDTNDLVRLIASKQLEVAVMRESDAYATFSGAAPFADNGRIALRTLAALGEHLFVCLEDVPSSAGYLLVEALTEKWHDIDPALVRKASGPRPSEQVRVPLHAGALDFYRDHA